MIDQVGVEWMREKILGKNDNSQMGYK